MGFVYVLYFDKPLGHAQRYLGVCSDFDRRLKQHCKGKGACITRAARAKGIHLCIEAVLELPTYQEAARLERKLKSWKCNRKAAEFLNLIAAQSH